MRTLREDRRRNQKGQITLMVVMALAIFMLGFAGLATDYASFWFTRQSVQGAADATCQAAAVDLYTYATGTNGPNMGFVPVVNTTIECATTPNAAPCKIAKLNGYDGTLASNHVSFNFPASVSGVTPPPGVVAFVQADVTRHAPTYFSKLLTREPTVDVHASAVCGLTTTPGPVPIVVLHPTDPSTIDMRGTNASIQIVGGPDQSVQVNSRNANAVTTGSLETVNLAEGGTSYTGSSFGTYGGQATQPGSVSLGSTGRWVYPHLPIADPYASVVAPSQPATLGRSTHVAFKEDGCPEASSSGCTEYWPGYYASGIRVHNETAIFVPGIYWIAGQGANNGLTLDSNSIVRISTQAGDGHGGVMFYFSGNSATSVYIDSNSGKPHGSLSVCSATPTNCIVKYHVDGSSEFGVESRPLICPASSKPKPDRVPDTIAGNVLLAPCDSTYGDPTGEYRGFLFFQDRAVAVDGSHGNNPPQWQGGGSTLAAGFMYFHNCRNGDHTGTGVCTGFGDTFAMGGTPGSGSYAVGSLITDKIYENGNPNLLMILHPDNTGTLVKIGFFR